MNINPAPGGKPWLPPMFFAASGLASLCLAGGILGLFAPAVIPALAEKTVAWTLVAVGVTFEGWSVAILLAAIAKRRR